MYNSDNCVCPLDSSHVTNKKITFVRPLGAFKENMRCCFFMWTFTNHFKIYYITNVVLTFVWLLVINKFCHRGNRIVLINEYLLYNSYFSVCLFFFGSRYFLNFVLRCLCTQLSLIKTIVLRFVFININFFDVVVMV